MSRVHLIWQLLEATPVKDCYRVSTPDLDDGATTQELGFVEIDHQAKDYRFVPSGVLLDTAFVPPKTYGLPVEALTAALRGEYEGHSYGAWTSRIHAGAIDRLRRRRRFEPAGLI